MEFSITDFAADSKPNVPKLDEKIYPFLGESGVRQLISDHYDNLAQSSIKELFPPVGEGLEEVKKLSADYFIKRLGGPNFYDENKKAPLLMKMHKEMAINNGARRVWLECYRAALTNLEMPEDLKQSYWDFLNVFSFWFTSPSEAR